MENKLDLNYYVCALELKGVRSSCEMRMGIFSKLLFLFRQQMVERQDSVHVNNVFNCFFWIC